MLQLETQKRSFIYEMFITFEPSLNIEFIKFLKKCYLLRSKYLFEERFAREIKLALPKCANIMKCQEKNIVLTISFS